MPFRCEQTQQNGMYESSIIITWLLNASKPGSALPVCMSSMSKMMQTLCTSSRERCARRLGRFLLCLLTQRRWTAKITRPTLDLMTCVPFPLFCPTSVSYSFRPSWCQYFDEVMNVKGMRHAATFTTAMSRSQITARRSKKK